MSITHALYQLLIGPLELIFEIVYGFSQNLFKNSGLSIIVLSVTVNTLLLPLYRCADAIQEEAKETEKKLAPWVAHIKKTFKGDERFMMLQTYYRQNGYKPFYVLKSSMPLFLEIPFFIAAYHFLSNLEALNGVHFGPIENLGAPDGMISLFGVTINLLPIVMTAINCVSSIIYSQGLSLKDKIQLYGMALIFLVLLYESPAGLVFYWTLNNLFSLGKNLFYRIRNPRYVLCVMLSILGILMLVYGIGFYHAKNWKHQLVVILVALMMELPLLLHHFQDKLHPFVTFLPKKNNLKLFLSGCVFLALLTGVLIPSAVIVSSPSEFVQIADFYSPIRHVLNASCLSIGFFIIWPTIFYCMASPKIKGGFTLLVVILSGAALVNYMFFGTKLGILSAMLQYETELRFSILEKLYNSVVLFTLATLLLLLFRNKYRLMQTVYFIVIISILGMSAINLWHIQSEMPKIEQAVHASGDKNLDKKAHFTLSRQGKNVIVLMLDRAISSHLPYIFQEKPELKHQFAGFIFYPNTISFGGCTNFGTPPLYGGYEYTPTEMNHRADESLVDKHNEALKIMPVLFDKAGFTVTVCDPPYANYAVIPDLSIYNEYPQIKAYVTEHGQFVFSLLSESEQCQQMNQVWERAFFCYSLMKISPLVFQTSLYQSGTYFNSKRLYAVQRRHGFSKAEGQDASFMESYAVLYSLPSMTRITDEQHNTLLLMCNSITHEPVLLQEPEYEPALSIDNTLYDNEHRERFILDGRKLKGENQMTHYHVNMVAMLLLGRWMDYLRNQGVYDNTRIIIVADHGRELRQFDDMILWKDTKESIDVMAFNPLFLVKDFNSHEFAIDTTFMTQADVPTLAFKDLIANPVNPFTHKPINSDLKHTSNQLITGSWIWSIEKNNGNTFLPSIWYSVHDNIFDPNNWEKMGEH